MKNIILKTLPLYLFAPVCWAHTGNAEINGLWYGMLHPLTGLDHLFTLLAIGMLASRNINKEHWLLPLVFLVAMVTGFVLSLSGVPLGATETLIAASVLILGLSLSFGQTLNGLLLPSAILLFGVAHGYAHGIEITGSATQFLAGFIATACLLILVTLLAFRYGLAGKKSMIQSGFGFVMAAFGSFFLFQL